MKQAHQIAGSARVGASTVGPSSVYASSVDAHSAGASATGPAPVHTSSVGASGPSLPRAAFVLVALALAVGGCTSRTRVPQAELGPGAVIERCIIFTGGEGTSYRFDRVHVKGDSLIGEFPISVERRSEGGITMETVMRSYPFALAQVDSVAIIRRDWGKTVLAAGGVGAFVVLLQQVTDTSLPKRRGPSGSTKPPPG